MESKKIFLKRKEVRQEKEATEGERERVREREKGERCGRETGGTNLRGREGE